PPRSGLVQRQGAELQAAPSEAWPPLARDGAACRLQRQVRPPPVGDCVPGSLAPWRSAAAVRRSAPSVSATGPGGGRPPQIPRRPGGTLRRGLHQGGGAPNPPPPFRDFEARRPNQGAQPRAEATPRGAGDEGARLQRTLGRRSP